MCPEGPQAELWELWQVGQWSRVTRSLALPSQKGSSQPRFESSGERGGQASTLVNNTKRASAAPARLRPTFLLVSTRSGRWFPEGGVVPR